MDIKFGRYRHYKGNEYEVLYMATHSETLEPMVVYKALYGTAGIWVRPASMWNENVEWHGRKMKRFEYIGDDTAIKVEEIDDYLKLAPLFKESGLEVKVEGPAPEHLVTCWKAEDEYGVLIGGVSVEHKVGVYTIGDIAVSQRYREKRVGEKLLITAMSKIKELGGTEIYIVAKAPKFFEKYGFGYITREEAPDFTNCLKCEQFQVSCFPELMKFKGL